MSKEVKQASTASTIWTTLFFIVASIGVALAINSCSSSNDQLDLAEKYRFIDEGVAEAKAARAKLPADFENLPMDNYIVMAHDCAVVMKNKLQIDDWFDWTNSATDTASSTLLDRANTLGINLSGRNDYNVSTFFENALSTVPSLAPRTAPDESVEFNFFVTTTSDTFGGLKMVLRKYSCIAFPSGNIWFREKDAQMY
jgi:hypothetical protein